MMELPIAQVKITAERDTVAARQLAQHVAELAGLTPQDRTRLATAVSEIARNALQYAGGGMIVCSVIEEERTQYLQFVISDEGPGIPNLREILDDSYQSRTGMGRGISGSRRLMDRFFIESEPGKGTAVQLAKAVPRDVTRINGPTAANWSEMLIGEASSANVAGVEAQNEEMRRSLNVLKHKEAELAQQLSEVERLNRELKHAQRALQEQATIDPLTGLLNRRAIMAQLDQELARSRRSGQPIGVLIGDLDHFKRLNDTYGHLAGDAALRETSRRMQTAARQYDAVGRYGGEEFLVVLPRCDVPGTQAAGERIRAAIGGEEMQLLESSVTVTMSIGAISSTEIADADLLIDVADAALYRAKDSGRNRVELATADDVEETLESRNTREAGPPHGADD